MAFSGSIAGLALTNISISGSVDTVIVESGSANTVPIVAEAYNKKLDISVEGIDNGFGPSSSVTYLSKTFLVTSTETKRTAGDVRKISIRGTAYDYAA
jgi:hypothetical protein